MSEFGKLIKSNRLEKVASDDAQVALLRDQARTHLTSSRMIGDTDPAGAFGLAYDSVRKAMTALLLEHGFRTRGAASHSTVGRAIASLVDNFDIESFEWMRIVRNATEYGSDTQPSATPADLEEAWQTAEELLAQIT